jgi:hypothetical protein
MTSRFLKKVAAPVSRFVARHRALQRIVQRVPIMTKFLAFFVPDELRLDPPKNELATAPAAEADTPHIAPVYNARARKPKGLTLG